VIVAFDPNAKFTPHGTLQGWQTGVGRVVKHQPIRSLPLPLPLWDH
jgi:hypothetical protein